MLCYLRFADAAGFNIGTEFVKWDAPVAWLICKLFLASWLRFCAFLHKVVFNTFLLPTKYASTAIEVFNL